MKPCNESFDWINHEAFCEKIAEMTNRNDHINAYIDACRYLEDFPKADKNYFAPLLSDLYLMRMRASRGFGLDGEVYEVVKSAYRKMMDAARYLLCDEAYDMFYSSF